MPLIHQEITPVEAFWSTHTVGPEPLPDAEASFAHLDWRSAEYPLFPELMDLWHAEGTVLDYGCGPASDLLGFACRSDASRIIGMDCSTKALDLAAHRLALHGISLELVKVSDAVPSIPLPDASVDHINCVGVLHHATYPNAILREFGRVLRVGGTARIMVHNYDSVWLHKYVAQDLLLGPWEKAGIGLVEAFRQTTDGYFCPISRVYRTEDFIRLCGAAGLAAEFRGGYYSAEVELSDWTPDPRLGAEHLAFRDALTPGPVGPLYNGLPAGIGGVYWCRK